MRGRLAFLVGFGAGYVLGAKAGTERYEQLRRLYGNVLQSKGIQKATGKAKDAASTGIETAKEKVGGLKDRGSSESHPGGLSVAPSPTNN
jgi:hypothetical protein